ncbi:MAG: Proline--tRNA ligase [Phycisphaerae bacterium]|nr:Proline--tRNA ligase [Phycisphaerae bacterium]
MHWNNYFIPTTRETPAEAIVPSHQLMLRAGLVKQLVAGAYIYLPLGYRVLQKITNIVREEMNRAGAIELHMPAMHPVELWMETGRVEAMGDTLIHLPDQEWRSGTVLGPTHEEIITHIVRSFVNSYKQLPINLYQIQTKFRDEKRPKSGVLRTREFLMKDAYSFHTSWVDLDREYRSMYDTYCRIYKRCGLPYVAVEAESGAMGGDASHEFMVATDAGEDILVRTGDSSYAANLERAAIAPPSTRSSTASPLESLQEVHTPHVGSVEQVSRFLGCQPADLIKTIIFVADDQPLVALVRGDHEVNEAKLRKAAQVRSLVAADPETIRKVTCAEVGFAGPVGLQVRIIVDQAVPQMQNAVTGANKTDYHLKGVNPGRDFEIKEVADIRLPVAGDSAPNGQPLVFEKCIEIGHVFKLGTKYSVSMKAHYQDAQGQNHPCIMGCYGIGVNRIMAAAIEAHHDDAGIIWPMSITPFQVLITTLDSGDELVISAARQLYDGLTQHGWEVLWDDRELRPGPKFMDADLIGVPLRLTIGKKNISQGLVELKVRNAAEVHKLSVTDALTRTDQLIREALATYQS